MQGPFLKVFLIPWLFGLYFYHSTKDLVSIQIHLPQTRSCSFPAVRTLWKPSNEPRHFQHTIVKSKSCSQMRCIPGLQICTRIQSVLRQSLKEMIPWLGNCLWFQFESIQDSMQNEYKFHAIYQSINVDCWFFFSKIVDQDFVTNNSIQVNWDGRIVFLRIEIIKISKNSFRARISEYKDSRFVFWKA